MNLCQDKKCLSKVSHHRQLLDHQLCFLQLVGPIGGVAQDILYRLHPLGFGLWRRPFLKNVWHFH